MKNIEPRSIPAWVICNLLTASAIVLIVTQFVIGSSFNNLPDEIALFALTQVLVFLIILAVIVGMFVYGKGTTIFLIVATMAAVFCVWFFSIIILESYNSKTLLLIILALFLLSFALSFLLSPNLQMSVSIALIMAALALQIFDSSPKEFLIKAFGLGPKPSVSRTVIRSGVYSIENLRFSNYFNECLDDPEPVPCAEPTTGGGISVLGEGYLLSDGSGRLNYFTVDLKTKSLAVRRLKTQVPLNEDQYLLRAGENAAHTFRVTDILVKEDVDRFQLLAAHHHWNADGECGTLRVSSTSGDIARFTAGRQILEWETLFESSPCLKVARENQLTRGGESGGRMAWLPDGRLMLTVGDHESDGIVRKPMRAQYEDNSYGKTILIDTRSGASEIFTIGHRNPQGLYVDDNAIWSTEHGPSGGDEINVLRAGANYGWPLVTYGTQYGELSWPWNARQGRHDGFAEPLFTWTQSIAISNIIRLKEGSVFPLWEGDFLLGTFKKALFHFRVVNDRVVFMEKLPISGTTGRIRDLSQDQLGRVVMYLDDHSVIFLSPLDMDSGGAEQPGPNREFLGETILSKCAACHQFTKRGGNAIGPNLFGVVGRRIAGADDYDYSTALSSLSGRWTRERLDAYLADPQQFAPGTSMAFSLQSPKEREAVLNYLEQRQ